MSYGSLILRTVAGAVMLVGIYGGAVGTVIGGAALLIVQAIDDLRVALAARRATDVEVSR